MSDAEARFLDSLYRGVASDVELEAALSLIQGMFNCRSAALVSLDAQAPRINIAMTTGVFQDAMRLYREQFVALDPAPAMFSRLAIGTASATDRMLTPEERDRHVFVQEFFRPLGLTETLGGNLSSSQGRFQLIGLQRGDDRPMFDDGDIARVERLLPHIARALQLRRAFLDMNSEVAGLRAAVDRLLMGVVLLNPERAAVFVNAAMRAIAGRGDGLSLDRSGRPLPANLAARQRLDQLLNDVASGGAGGILTVPRADNAGDYVVLVAPSPPALYDTGWDRGRTWHDAGAMVLVHDPERRADNAVDLLQRGLHLPKSAARLVAALAADDDLRSFAERERVTIHTARFHLRTALARTGARTQAELVRIAVRLLRDLALSRDGQ